MTREDCPFKDGPIDEPVAMAQNRAQQGPEMGRTRACPVCGVTYEQGERPACRPEAAD